MTNPTCIDEIPLLEGVSKEAQRIWRYKRDVQEMVMREIDTLDKSRNLMEKIFARRLEILFSINQKKRKVKR